MYFSPEDGAFNVSFGVGLPRCDAGGDTEEMAMLENGDAISDFTLDRSSSDNAVLQGTNSLFIDR